MTLPHSDACFVAAYPAAATEAWLDGHNRAFVFFGGVPQSILHDNDKCLVSRILSDGTRQRTRAFSGLQSHYLFEDRYGRPGKGNDKGNVEGVVGYARRNFMTPLPRFASWDAFNGHLEEQCRNRQGNVLRGHRESIGERFVRDREALKRPLPAPFDACDKQGTRVDSLSLVRYRTNDYSVPVAYGHQEVWIRGYVHEVVIGCGAGIIARHPRSYDREDMVFDPIHYLPLLEHKIGALDQAAPLGHRTERGHDRLRRHRDPEPALPVPLDPGSAIVPVLDDGAHDIASVLVRGLTHPQLDLLGRLGARLGTKLLATQCEHPGGRHCHVNSVASARPVL